MQPLRGREVWGQPGFLKGMSAAASAPSVGITAESAVPTEGMDLGVHRARPNPRGTGVPRYESVLIESVLAEAVLGEYVLAEAVPKPAMRGMSDSSFRFLSRATEYNAEMREWIKIATGSFHKEPVAVRIYLFLYKPNISEFISYISMLYFCLLN